METRLYRWSSVALKQYGNGHIIVMSRSVEAARKAARSVFDSYLKSYYSYYWNQFGIFVGDEDDNQQIRLLQEAFERDILFEPMEVIEGVVLIAGSE